MRGVHLPEVSTRNQKTSVFGIFKEEPGIRANFSMAKRSGAHLPATSRPIGRDYPNDT